MGGSPDLWGDAGLHLHVCPAATASASLFPRATWTGLPILHLSYLQLEMVFKVVPWPPQGVKIFSELLLCIWKADILTDVLVSLICLLLQGVSAKNWEGSRESDFFLCGSELCVGHWRNGCPSLKAFTRTDMGTYPSSALNGRLHILRLSVKLCQDNVIFLGVLTSHFP